MNEAFIIEWTLAQFAGFGGVMMLVVFFIFRFALDRELKRLDIRHEEVAADNKKAAATVTQEINEQKLIDIFASYMQYQQETVVELRTLNSTMKPIVDTYATIPEQQETILQKMVDIEVKIMQIIDSNELEYSLPAIAEAVQILNQRLEKLIGESRLCTQK